MNKSNIELTAYCVVTNRKAVPIQDAVIHRTARGGCIAIGHDGNGNKLSSLISELKANDCVKAGIAKLNTDVYISKIKIKYMENSFNQLIEEQAQLSERIYKISAFIDSAGFVGIGHNQQILLRIQLKAMETYQRVLQERIVLLSIPFSEFQGNARTI